MYYARVILFSILTFPVIVNAATTYGHGTKSCGLWAKERKAHSVTSRYFEVWVLGFISGSGIVLDVLNKVQRKTDSDAAFLYIDSFCNQNPLAPIGEAAQVLVAELITQK